MTRRLRTRPAWLAVLSALLLATSSAWAAGSYGTKMKDKSLFYGQRFKQTLEHGLPSFQEVSVHDPSVIEVDGSYYIFGSHLATAKTTNLMNWELIADGVNEDNPLFVNVVEELAATFEWSDAVDLWANEVIRLADGRFYMYHNLSRLDSPRASLGLAVADHIEGPYVNHGIFLQSGMWNEISEDGVNIYDARIHPNTVDPDLFFDQEGTLWMIYGSYSGGIFIMEMDPVTGFPLEGQGYGKHLMGGNHSRIEGAFVIYSPQSGYYYMFVTFGGLSADGGYNIRVSRSVNADGPYYDALGNDMAEVKANPALPLFDDASIEPFAQKLMGNHFFLRADGEPGNNTGFGYVSPGHNSAIYDPESGKYFIIFHTRFPGRGEMHQVRVHEMFINEDGWVVVAPHRYVPVQFLPYKDAPYRFGGSPFFMDRCRHKPSCWNFDTITPEESPGMYKLVNHGKDISAEVKVSELVSLTPDGSVSGAVSGSWYRSYGNRITIELDDVGLFKGVVSRGWNETSGQFVITFSAQSVEGISIWGSKLAE
ncbi:glycoside hydrolase family 43 protein [Pseudomonadota bacterium]